MKHFYRFVKAPMPAHLSEDGLQFCCEYCQTIINIERGFYGRLIAGKESLEVPVEDSIRICNGVDHDHYPS